LGLGRFAWQADNLKTFVRPIPHRGIQGMFNVPDDILPKLAAEERTAVQ
jgi:hypothetical protein